MAEPVKLRTFDEAFSELRLKPEERTALVWHLASMRARKTIEALLPETSPTFDPRDYGLRAQGARHG